VTVDAIRTFTANIAGVRGRSGCFFDSAALIV